MADSDYSDIDSEFNADTSGEESDISSSMQENDTGVLPYQFEPRTVRDYSQYSSSDDEEDGVPEDRQPVPIPRIDNTEWCSCTHCTAMPTDRECLCCMESEETKREMTDYSKEFSAELRCITEHPGFATVCLDRWVLKVAYRQYKQQYGEVSNKNEQWRYIAYRQYVRWCWGFLGKNVRVILPACVVNKIRTHYPSELYKGFEEA